MTEPPAHDDDLADAVALVAAWRRDDAEAIGALLQHCDLLRVAVLLSRLLAVAADEGGASIGEFRDWAATAAVKRGAK